MAVGFCAVHEWEGDGCFTSGVLAAYTRFWEHVTGVHVERIDVPGFRALVAHRQPRSLIASTERTALLFAGRAYAENPDGPHPDAATLIGDAEQGGPSTLEGLNGNYVAVCFERGIRRLTAVADRAGNARAYTYERPGAAVVTSQYTPLLAVPGVSRTLNKTALAEYLSFGCNLEDRTLFDSIRYLQGRHTWTVDRGNASVRQYWDFRFQDDNPAQTAAEYGEAYLHLLRRAVRRRTNGPALMPITAGMDARLVACAVSQERDTGDIPAFTLGRPACYDVRDGRRIARTLGFPHSALDIPPGYFARTIEDGLRRSDAAVIGHTCWRMAADAFLEAHAGASILSGCWGEFIRVYRDDPAIDPAWSLEEQFQHHKRTHNEWFFMAEDAVPRLLRPQVAQEVQGFTDSVLRRLFLHAPAEHPRHKLEHLSFANWWPRRYVRMISDYATDLCPVTFPYNDTEVVDFELRVPREVRKNGAVLKHIFAHAFPRVGAIPYARTAMPIHGGPARMLYHRLKGFGRYKVLPRLRRGTAAPNWGAYVLYRQWLRQHNAEFVRNALAELGPLEAYLDPGAVRRAADEVLDGRSGDYGKVYSIAALSLYMRSVDAR